MKKLIFIIVIIASARSFTQNIPQNFSFDEKKLNKMNDVVQGSNTVERIVVEGNNIWFGTSRGLSKTTDGGVSFTNFYDDEVFGTESISAVGYGNGTIWAAKWHSEELAGGNIPTGGGLCYSTNGGVNWVTIDQPVDDPGDSSIVYGINNLRALPVTVPQQNFVYQIAFTKNTVWIATFAGGLRKSTDMGKTWQRVVLPPDNLDSISPDQILKFSLQPQAGKFGTESYLNHRVFSVAAVDDDTLYVGTAGGINRSTDGGISWVKFNYTNQEHPISGNFIWTLVYNYADNSIWAATWKAEGQNEFYSISVSRDGGKSWDVTLPDEKTHDIAFNYYGQAPGYTSYDIIAATENGLYRTNNNGITWVVAPTIIDKKTNYNLTTKKFLSVESEKTGFNEFNVWSGTDNEGLIKFSDKSGSWNGDFSILLKSGNKVSPGESFAFPNPFSSGNEIVRIKFNVQTNSSVTIRIFDFGMNLVRTIIQNAARNINDNQIETWNGKDEDGKIVPNGVYFYRIDIGSEEPIYGKIMVLM